MGDRRLEGTVAPSKTKRTGLYGAVLLASKRNVCVIVPQIRRRIHGAGLFPAAQSQDCLARRYTDPSLPMLLRGRRGVSLYGHSGNRSHLSLDPDLRVQCRLDEHGPVPGRVGAHAEVPQGAERDVIVRPGTAEGLSLSRPGP